MVRGNLHVGVMKDFIQDSNLNSHMFVHAVEKPYTCESVEHALTMCLALPSIMAFKQ